MSDDHYQILGVSRTATSEDIQKAYREMARKYHPDLHPDDDAAKEQFKKVQTAFDVLNDPSKREMYDRYGSSFEGVGAGGGGWSPQGQQGGFQSGGEVDLESLLEVVLLTCLVVGNGGQVAQDAALAHQERRLLPISVFLFSWQLMVEKQRFVLTEMVPVRLSA